MLAYIDPGSGTLILQTLIAIVIGAIAFFRRTLWGSLRVLFGGRDAEHASKD